MTSKNVILDIDGVLADFEGKFCETYRCWDNRHMIRLEERVPVDWLGARIVKWTNNPKTYQHLKLILLGKQIAQFINEQGYDICLVSNRPDTPEFMRITVTWLKSKKIPFSSISLGAGDKSKAIENLRPVLVIDDMPVVIANSLKFGSFGALMDSPWNRSANFPKIRNFSGFIEIWEQRMNHYEYMQREYSSLSA